MLINLDVGEAATLRPGDVVFHHRPGGEFPTHACLYVGPGESATAPLPKIAVRGVPGYRKAITSAGREDEVLGQCMTGDRHAWFANLVGQMVAVEDAHLRFVVLLSEGVGREHSQLGQECEWHQELRIDRNRLVLGQYPLFVKGTCTHFVEYLYESCGLDIVHGQTFDPEAPGRIYPATQIAAFWSGAYPLRTAWDARLATFPDCLFGPRSTQG